MASKFTPYQHVYEELRKARAVRDKTEFGQKLGYSKTHASQLMNGHEPITDSVIMRLYNVFGVNPDFMKGDSKEMYAEEQIKENELLKLTRENNRMLKAIMKKLDIK